MGLSASVVLVVIPLNSSCTPSPPPSRPRQVPMSQLQTTTNDNKRQRTKREWVRSNATNTIRVTNAPIHRTPRTQRRRGGRASEARNERASEGEQGGRSREHPARPITHPSPSEEPQERFPSTEDEEHSKGDPRGHRDQRDGVHQDEDDREVFRGRAELAVLANEEHELSRRHARLDEDHECEQRIVLRCNGQSGQEDHGGQPVQKEGHPRDDQEPDEDQGHHRSHRKTRR